MKIPTKPNSTLREFYHSTMWIDNDIMYCKLKPHLLINTEVAAEMLRDWGQLHKGVRRPMIVDYSELLFVEPAARKQIFASKAVGALYNAVALYTEDKFLALLGKVILLIDRPSFPMKLVSQLMEGVTWLEEFKDLPGV